MKRSILILALAVAALAPASAFAQDAGPDLRAHPIFAGGMKTFHVGAVILVDAKGAKPTQVCLDPAPIARPACSSAKLVAPSAAGTTHITATFADGTVSALDIEVLPAARRVGGPIAVPGRVRCTALQLFMNYNQRTGKLVTRRGTLLEGGQLAIYNKVDDDVYFVWDYRTNQNGFARRACIAPGSAATTGVAREML